MTRHSLRTSNARYSTILGPCLQVIATTFETVHQVSGLTWAYTIPLTTFILRSSISLPVAIYARERINRLARLRPLTEAWRETLRMTTLRQAPPSADPRAIMKHVQQQYRQKVSALYRRHHCHPYHTIILPFVQIPLFILVSLSLQGMVGLAVPLIPDIRDWVPVVKEMRSEGIEWLQPDLMQSDVSALLPVLIGTTNLVNVEVGSFLSAPASQTRRPFRAQAVLIWLYRGMSIAVIPIAMQVPSVKRNFGGSNFTKLA